MTLTLYYNPMSRAQMSRCLLEEIGCPFEIKLMSYEDGSLRNQEYLELNPMGKIPTLTDGDTVVTETTAIAIYLADKYKTPNDLAPTIDDPRRGEYLRWLAFQSGAIEGAMMQAATKVEIKRAQASWGDVDLVISVLKARLATADPYLFGDWFTAADLILGLSLAWAIQFGMFPPEPELTAYADRVRTRPIIAKVMAEAGG